MKMKYHNYLIAIGIFLIAVAHISCKKSSLMVYDSPRNLYFDVSKKTDLLNPSENLATSVDSVAVLFALMEDALTNTELKIPVKMTGPQSDQPLAYTISIDPSASTAVEGKDFEWSKQHLFPAKKNVDTLRIKVNRTATMLAKTLTLTLELKQNENFQTMILPNETNMRATKVKCYFNDILPPPPGYVTTATSTGADFYYGTFSKKKLLIITKAAEEARFFFPPQSAKSIYSNWLVPMQALLSSILNSYLEAQKFFGNTIYEEDGTEMTAGPFY